MLPGKRRTTASIRTCCPGNVREQLPSRDAARETCENSFHPEMLPGKRRTTASIQRCCPGNAGEQLPSGDATRELRETNFTLELVSWILVSMPAFSSSHVRIRAH